MRFSTVATLCAAPLALASSLQADLVARGALIAERAEKAGTKANSNSGSSGNTIIVQEAAPATEVIVIWVNNGGGAATQTVTTTQTVIASQTVAAASVATHTVVVGGTAGLVYTPEEVVAAVGDMVIFTFLSQNHTATQSAFTTPCEKLTGGMDSGFMANINSSVSPPPQMAMQVTVATPIWFYCRQAGHCGKGMTFSINPQTSATGGNKTQAAFKALAIMQNGTGSTAVIAGGAGAASTPVSVASATASAAAVQSAAAGSGSMVSGTGTLNSAGACACSCLCGTAAFPAAVQGIGAFGGMSGAMPMSALEVTVNTS